MNPLTDQELAERRIQIRSADTSFALTETLADMLVDIAGQASGQQDAMTTINDTLATQLGDIAGQASGQQDALTTINDTLATQLGDIAVQASSQQAALTTINDTLAAQLGDIAVQASSQQAALTTINATLAAQLGDIAQSASTVCAPFSVLAERGSEHHPLHVRLEGTSPLIVQLQPEALERLVGLVQDLRVAMFESSARIAQTIEQHGIRSPASAAHLAQLEERLAALELRAAEHEQSLKAPGHSGASGPRPRPRRNQN
jgi:hypothetical protein